MSGLEEDIIGSDDDYDIDEEEKRDGRRDWRSGTYRAREDEDDGIDPDDGEAVEELDDDKNEELDDDKNEELDENKNEELDEDKNEDGDHIQSQHSDGGLEEAPSDQNENKQEEVSDEQEVEEEAQEHVASEEVEGDEEESQAQADDDEDEEDEEDDSRRSRFKSERSSEGSKISLTTTKVNRNITGSLEDIIKEKKIDLVVDQGGRNHGRGGRGGQNYGRGGRGMGRGAGGLSGQRPGQRYQQGSVNRFQGQMPQHGFQVQQWNPLGLMGARPQSMGMYNQQSQMQMQMQVPVRNQYQGPAAGMMSSALKFFDMISMNNQYRTNGPNDGMRFPMNNTGMAGQHLQNQNVSRPINPVAQLARQSSSSAHNYLKNFAHTQTGVSNKSDLRNSFGTGNTNPGPLDKSDLRNALDKSDLRNSLGTGRDVRNRLGGFVTSNQDARSLIGAGSQGNTGDLRSQLGGGAGNQDLRSIISRGLAGRQNVSMHSENWGVKKKRLN